jgi:26S proteasome regulatory subunit N6
LRQRIDLRLAALRLQRREYPAALALIAALLSEVKRLDDKLLLVDVHLLESRAHHALRNLPKARAALTAARTAANSIYVPVATQAEIDAQSGVLHAEEKDYKTAYSYFFEAFEQYSSLGVAAPAAPAVPAAGAAPAASSPSPSTVVGSGAVPALKYMLLCKVMSGGAADVPALAAAKTAAAAGQAGAGAGAAGSGGARFAGRDVDALVAVARAHQERSLAALQQALRDYERELSGDPVVHSHLSALYDDLLEGNLARLVEPYSRVQVGYLAELIGLPEATVEAKLSQMVLDKRLHGTLDQGSGCLDVFPPPEEDKLYPPALELMDALGGVLETLFARSQKLVSV